MEGFAIAFWISIGVIVVCLFVGLVWSLLDQDFDALGFMAAFAVIPGIMAMLVGLFWLDAYGKEQDAQKFKEKYHLDYAEISKTNSDDNPVLQFSKGGVSCVARFDTSGQITGYVIYKDGMLCDAGKPAPELNG